MNRNDHCCFIINSIVPYCWDLNHILALPTGFYYRNRWLEKWVDPSLKNNIEQLVSRRVLLMLRDYANDRLIPVRWGKLTFAQRIGQVFYFEYVLEDLVDYDSDETARTAQIDAFNREFLERHANVKRGPNQDIAPSVFMSQIGAELRATPANNLDKWGSVVAAVGEINTYEGVEFLKIVEISSSSNDTVAIRDCKYELKPNTVYEMRLFQWVPNPGQEALEPHDIELNTLRDHILVLRGQQRAVGRYDMLRFIFKVEDLRPGESSFVEVHHRPHPTRGEAAIPSIYLPVIIKSKAKISYIVRTLFTVVALLFTFSPDLFGLLTVDADKVRGIAIILFILLVTGWRRVWEAFWPKF